MRLAHIMAGARLGGAELFFERICAGLQAAGDEVLAVIRHDPVRAARLRDAGIAVAELEFGTPWLDWRTRTRLRALLRGFAPHVAMSWMSRASAHMPSGPWVTAGRLGGYYDLRHYRACEHLVGNTHGIVSWLRRRGWPIERTHYLPNFVEDLGGQAPAPDLSGAPRPVLLGLGRLHTDKGFDTLIDALALVPDASLAIAGAGPQEARLRHRAAWRGVARRMHFLGWRGDVGALLAACDVFVCSSRVEPLGNMVLEAWSARRPVVALAASGPREVINDQADGLLVPLERPDMLAAAIVSVLADRALAMRLSQSGRARFEAEFAAAPVLCHWQRFLHTLASCPMPTPQTDTQGDVVDRALEQAAGLRDPRTP